MQGNMFDELIIYKFRMLYESLFPMRNKQHVVTSELGKLVADFGRLAERVAKQEYISDQERSTIIFNTDRFVREAFPNSIYTTYSKPPKVEPKPMVLKGEPGYFKYLMDRVPEIKRKYSRQTVSDIEFKFRFIKNIHDCLKNCGLHPDIQKRDRASMMRYNIIIEYNDKRGEWAEYEWLLSPDKLRNKYLLPYHDITTIHINGLRITVRDVTKLTITTTMLKDEEIKHFKLSKNISSWEGFVERCTDETNLILDDFRESWVLGKVVEGHAGDGFLDKFILGIRDLQKRDTSEQFIAGIKSNGKREEGAFRNWFSTYFKGAYASVENENPKGKGRIDLRIEDVSIGTKIIEFKGWWNASKEGIVAQLLNYLTDFEHTGYVLMVNHLKSGITDKYRAIIESPETGYVDGSWDEKRFGKTDFKYYISRHFSGSEEKAIYHFIFKVYT